MFFYAAVAKNKLINISHQIEISLNYYSTSTVNKDKNNTTCFLYNRLLSCWCLCLKNVFFKFKFISRKLIKNNLKLSEKI